LQYLGRHLKCLPKCFSILKIHSIFYAFYLGYLYPVNLLDKYETVIGLEVHAQLNTNSKLFCGDSATYGASANTHISPFTLAHPGTLPKMNEAVIDLALKLGLALQCDIEQQNYFARKNYFYPDLPKGYQVSQHTTPICKNGIVSITVNEVVRNIKLNRIHIEEDAGKSIHDLEENFTCIDLNRAGVPLLEIVSEPDMHSSDEAFAYVTTLRKLLRWLNVCDGNMEEGSLRCDANISIRLRGEKKLGTRVEIKNLNSIRNVKRAIDVEVQRLIQLTETGQPIVQQTRSYNVDNNTTTSLRSKEDADDYRYFAEPDLSPFFISTQKIEDIKKLLPTLPNVLQQKFVAEYQLPIADAKIICEDKFEAEYFEEIVLHTNQYKAAANWVLGPIKNYLNSQQIDITTFPLLPKQISNLIALVQNQTVSFTNASTTIFNELIKQPNQQPLAIAEELNVLMDKNNDTLIRWVEQVLNSMPDKVAAYKAGKKGLIGVFAGEVKKISKGKADMQLVNKLLLEKL
jgi:aspartyl-tRNA(Asn)/glutamyl-tRNA(Gln) amidotransferase subunit B